jgi:glucan 1,4-alpha-maltotetraohydrolase
MARHAGKTGYSLLVLLGCMGNADAADTAGKSPNSVRYHGGDEIVLQGFHWNVIRTVPTGWYGVLKDKAPTIAADGFTAVWMPPPWRDSSSWSDPATGTSGGGEGYFWHDFNKNSRYGSDAQLKAAAAALNQAKVKPIYDIVPNHSNRAIADKELDIPAGQQRWRKDCPDTGAGPSDCDDGDPFMSGDADLNLGNPQNVALFQQELAALHGQYGGGGFRFDFIRGYAGKHVDDWMASADDGGLCVGELWKGPSEFPPGDPRRNQSWQEILKGWTDEAKCTVFDFALKERMQNGTIAEWRHGLNGNPDPRWREVAVTFVDNHDTGYSPGPHDGQHHWALPDNLRKQAYAYILSGPGTPAVYWPHMYDWGLGDYIRQLIQIRRGAGVRADSAIRFHTNYSGLVATVDGSQQQLVLALNSNLANPGQVAAGNFAPAMDTDNGQIRIWRSYAPANLVDVRFECANGTTQPGDSVYVSGSIAELGNWDPAKAVRLTDNSAYPTWKGNVALPAGQTVEWKCLIRSESDAAQVRTWQPDPNNRLTPAEGATAVGRF